MIFSNFNAEIIYVYVFIYFYLIPDVHRIAKADIIFAISSASSDAANTYRTVNKAVQSIIKEYGMKKLTYSLLTFDAQQGVKLLFKIKFTSKYNLKDFVQNIRYTTAVGDPNLEKALSKAASLFTKEDGHREDAAKVVIALIDASSVRSKDNLLAIIDRYDKEKIKLVPVIIGNEVSANEVLSIAPDNTVKTTTQEDPDRLGKRIMDMVHKG